MLLLAGGNCFGRFFFFFQGWRGITACIQWRIWGLAGGGGGGNGSHWVGSVGGNAPVGVPGGFAPWTLKAFSICELDNRASIRLKHEEINSLPKMLMSIHIMFRVRGRPYGFWWGPGARLGGGSH